MATRPIRELRVGLIKVRIWQKKTRNGVNHVITLARLFNNGDEWKESTRFGPEDVPLIRALLDEAHLWITKNRLSQKS